MFYKNAKNKGADQPALQRSLISAIVLRCMDNIMLRLAYFEFFQILASLCSCLDRFECSPGAIYENRFSYGGAHMEFRSYTGRHERVTYENN